MFHLSLQMRHQQFQQWHIQHLYYYTRDRQTDRQTDRPTDRDRHTDRQTERESTCINALTDIDTGLYQRFWKFYKREYDYMPI